MHNYIGTRNHTDTNLQHSVNTVNLHQKFNEVHVRYYMVCTEA